MGSAGHSRALWAITTLVVIGYSYLLATVLPFFSELVSTEHCALHAHFQCFESFATLMWFATCC